MYCYNHTGNNWENEIARRKQLKISNRKLRNRKCIPHCKRNTSDSCRWHLETLSMTIKYQHEKLSLPILEDIKEDLVTIAPHCAASYWLPTQFKYAIIYASQ